MKLLSSLSIPLLAVSCLAAGSNSSNRASNSSKKETNALVDRAYTLGLALGKSYEVIIDDTPSANTISLKVSREELRKFIWDNLNWKENGQTYNPFNGLIDEEGLSDTLARDYANMNLENFQYIFSTYMLSLEAKVILDVAMLKWLAGLINRENKDYCFVDMVPNILVNIEPCIIGPVCSLSLYPQLIERCKKDILTVLDEVEQLIASGKVAKEILLGEFYPILLTLSNRVDDGSIRWKAEQLRDSLSQLDCPNYEPICKLVSKAMTGMDKLSLRPFPSLHSLTNLPSLDPNDPFLKIAGFYLRAAISAKGGLNWGDKKISSYD